MRISDWSSDVCSSDLEKLLAEVRVDPHRVHFLGRVPYDLYLQVLRVSRVHTYLTFPFVLSWSMLESMAVGCCMVASATPPRSEEHTSELQSLMRISYAVFCLKKKTRRA